MLNWVLMNDDLVIFDVYCTLSTYEEVMVVVGGGG